MRRHPETGELSTGGGPNGGLATFLKDESQVLQVINSLSPRRLANLTITEVARLKLPRNYLSKR